MVFWLVAGTLTLIVSGILAMAVMRAYGDGHTASNQDLRIYRNQLDEIDRDVARGTLTAKQAGSVRTEVSRRLLEADRRAQATRYRTPPRYVSTAVAFLVCVVLVAGSTGLYLSIGAPGYPDLRLADRIALTEERHRTRMGQAEAEAAAMAEARAGSPRVAPDDVDPALPDLMERLRTAVSRRPNDLEGLKLLAYYEEVLGDFRAAHSAQSRLIALKGEGVTADDHATHARLLVLAANGFVSPEAERALHRALQLDPGHGPARYLTGLMLAQSGRPDLAFDVWQALLEEGPPDAAWLQPIRERIGYAARAAGIRYDLPDDEPRPFAGPTVEDMDAAREMDAADRQEMIRGMVDGLAERIEGGESGSPVEWARLIRSLGVLGDTVRGSEFWSKAQTEFADDPKALAIIRAAAVNAGVAE